MSRSGGEATKQRILRVSEKLFSQYGFEGTSIDRIARAAHVNRALIYYHFSDKNDLITGLFASILSEISDKKPSDADESASLNDQNIAAKVRREIERVDARRRVLTIMLMEALKEQKGSDALFRCAELVIKHEARTNRLRNHTDGSAEDPLSQPELIFEFFTGFIPLIAFVAFRRKWCQYFECDSDQALSDFVEVFQRTHLGVSITNADKEPDLESPSIGQSRRRRH